MNSHASLPVPVNLGGNLFRIFFSTRAKDSRSSIGWVDMTLTGDGHFKLGQLSQEPVLAPGPDGTFDDSGIGLGCILPEESGWRLYYMGWNIGLRAPWRNSIGMALGTLEPPSFVRFSAGPIMDRSPEDPFTLSYPWVLKLADDCWHMWYGSNTTWGNRKDADMNHLIKYATSKDGIQWKRQTDPAINFSSDSEYALARPTVEKVNGELRMWFACRGERYRIGCARSNDLGASWQRADEEFGLAPQDDGWDSDMTCYPCVFHHAGQLWMLYNGNGYGATGFGLALWQDTNI